MSCPKCSFCPCCRFLARNWISSVLACTAIRRANRCYWSHHSSTVKHRFLRRPVGGTLWLSNKMNNSEIAHSSLFVTPKICAIYTLCRSSCGTGDNRPTAALMVSISRAVYKINETPQQPTKVWVKRDSVECGGRAILYRTKCGWFDAIGLNRGFELNLLLAVEKCDCYIFLLSLSNTRVTTTNSQLNNTRRTDSESEQNIH